MPESRFSVGNVEIVGLTDIEVEFPMPLTQLFPHVPLAAWTPHQQRYRGISRVRIPGVPISGVLGAVAGRTILVDTGMGSTVTNPGAVAMFTGGADGHLLDELQAVGVRPEDIDTVFLTHLHPDHVGWNLRPGGGPAQATFPRARYLAHQADWEAFKTPEVQGLPVSVLRETLGPLETLGVLELLAGEQALTSEITAIPTPGHPQAPWGRPWCLGASGPCSLGMLRPTRRR